MNVSCLKTDSLLTCYEQQKVESGKFKKAFFIINYNKKYKFSLNIIIKIFLNIQILI